MSKSIGKMTVIAKFVWQYIPKNAKDAKSRFWVTGKMFVEVNQRCIECEGVL